MEALSLEEETNDDCEDGQGDDFLNDFQLYKCERSSVADEADAVGRHGKAVLDEGYAPREGDDGYQGPVAADAGFLQAQMAVPGKGHEDVAGQKKEYGL